MCPLRHSDELAAVVTAQPQPAILVGHSLGGAIIRHYAAHHPADVRGLVFVDATHEDFQELTQRGEDLLAAPFLLQGETHAAAEAQQFRETLETLRALPPLPDVPTVALTAFGDLQALGASTETLANWQAAHASLGSGTTQFEHVVLDEVGHFIHEESPDAVLDAIRSVIIQSTR